jgi:proton-dependent oligopeptide transporter, POT family
MNVATTLDAAPARELLGHPRGLVTLFFTEMWERLSYYGMRALLVLFMTDQVVNGGMNLTDAKANAIYGIYIGAVYLVSLPGGWIADRLLGAQRAIFFGGVIIMAGHFVLAIPSVYSFFLGLILVVLGTGLLKPNVSAVVGELYPPGDPRRDGGFTIFYMGINVGALLGPLVCGTLAQSEGWGNWHYGFAAAGVGMLFGLVQFRMTRHYLGQAGLEPYSTGDAARDAAVRRKGWRAVAVGLGVVAVVVALTMTGVFEIQPERFARRTTWFIIILSVVYFAWIFLRGGLDTPEKKRMVVIIALFIGTAMFWAGFEQTGSSFNIFADRYTVLEFESFTLLSTWFQSVNPVFIIIFAPVFAWMWVALARRNLNPSTPFKFGLGLILLAVGFLTMMAASQIVATGAKVLPTWLLLTYMFHTWGELCLSPVGLSATTKLAPKRYVGQMMGVWFMGTALGNVISGLIAGEFNPNDLQAFPGQYLKIFLTIGGAGIVFLVLTKPLKKLMGNVE